MVVVVCCEFYSPSHDSFCCVQLSIISEGPAGVVVIFLLLETVVPGWGSADRIGAELSPMWNGKT